MTTIVDSTGKPLFLISGDEETALLNIPVGCIAVDDPPSSNVYYHGGWVDREPQPTPFHEFDYITKEWVDSRSIEEVKNQKWAEIKAQRDQLEFGGFAFEGNIYDSDQVSQGRIMGAAAAGVDQVWTLADNTSVELTASQLQQLYSSLQAFIASVHERGRTARQIIYDAETKEEVEAVQL